LVGEFGAQVELLLERQGFLVLPDRPLARSYDLYLMLGRRRNVGHPTICQSGAIFRHREVSDCLAQF